jgi:hypothetical protein
MALTGIKERKYMPARKYFVVKCSCGEENVFPIWVEGENSIDIKLTGEHGVTFACGNPDCGAEMEILARPITPKELDNLKATMSVTGTKEEVERLTL